MDIDEILAAADSSFSAALDGGAMENGDMGSPPSFSDSDAPVDAPPVDDAPPPAAAAEAAPPEAGDAPVELPPIPPAEVTPPAAPPPAPEAPAVFTPPPADAEFLRAQQLRQQQEMQRQLQQQSETIALMQQRSQAPAKEPGEPKGFDVRAHARTFVAPPILPDETQEAYEQRAGMDLQQHIIDGSAAHAKQYADQVAERAAQQAVQGYIQQQEQRTQQQQVQDIIGGAIGEAGLPKNHPAFGIATRELGAVMTSVVQGEGRGWAPNQVRAALNHYARNVVGLFNAQAAAGVPRGAPPTPQPSAPPATASTPANVPDAPPPLTTGGQNKKESTPTNTWSAKSDWEKATQGFLADGARRFQH